jgi:hypothetical protein
MSKTRIITMNKITLNGALLKSGLTMLVLAGTMFAAPVAHSAAVECRATDSCKTTAVKPLGTLVVKISAACTLNGKPSYGTLKYTSLISGSGSVYFTQATYTKKLITLVRKKDVITAEVLCDYRHDRNPTAYAEISW